MPTALREATLQTKGHCWSVQSACQTTAGPGEHPQTAHNQAAGDSKDHPCLQKQARTKYSQEGKNPSKYLETAPENQNSRAQAAHAIEQEATM